MGVLAACSGGGPVPKNQDGNSKVKYGPFNIGANGMLWNNMAFGIQKPCEDCFITGMQAGLEDTAGNSVNINKGLWLHHMVLGHTNASDSTCAFPLGLIFGERFFASGNERSPWSTGSTYGYPVNSGDSWMLDYDLMNMNSTPASVYVTVQFSFVAKSKPGMRPVRPVWLDVAQCATSEVPAKTGAYNYQYQWSSTLSGPLLGIGGHVHDGGDRMDIQVNGQTVCNSVAHYGESPEYIEAMDGMDHGGTPTTMAGGDMGHMAHPGMPHISSMDLCFSPTGIVQIRAGDVFKIIAYYDSAKHQQMGDEPVMGIAVGYIGQ